MSNALKKHHLDLIHWWPKSRHLQKAPYLVSTIFFLYFTYKFATFRLPTAVPKSAHSAGSAWLHEETERGGLHNFSLSRAPVSALGNAVERVGVGGGEGEAAIGANKPRDEWTEEESVGGGGADAAHVQDADTGKNKSARVVAAHDAQAHATEESADAAAEWRKNGGDVHALQVDSGGGGEAGKGTGNDVVAGRGEGGCLKYVVYDKPVKTGSTAVRDALVEYLREKGQGWLDCTFAQCNLWAEKMLKGAVQYGNLIEHLQGDMRLVERLGKVGFYKVTSIREPLERWESAYRYNKMMGGGHYGIGEEVGYAEFMGRMPACGLYDFYDGLGAWCEMTDVGIEERIRGIVGRYDEILDLYQVGVGSSRGVLHNRLDKWIRVSNKSPDYSKEGEFDLGRLQNETKLYNALKKRRLELIGREPKLC